MEMTTRPLFALYVMWHPSYREGREIADRLRRHFGRDLHRSVGEERGVSVLERSEPVPGTRTPLPIDWDDAEFTAVVVLVETALIGDHEWADHVRGIAQTAHGRGIPYSWIDPSTRATFRTSGPISGSVARSGTGISGTRR